MFDLFVFTVNCQSKQYFCSLFNAFCNPLCEFEKITFDTLWHSGLLYKLLTTNVGCTFFNVIQNIYSLCQSAIKIDNKHSDYFKIERGVKQGDSLSLVYLTILQMIYMIYLMNLVVRLSLKTLFHSASLIVCSMQS
jgi:hypothetical protein